MPCASVLAAGVMVLVDAQGEPFKRLAPGERGQLPVITGVDGTALVADPAGSKARIARALEVVVAYAEKRRPLLSEVHVDIAGGVTLYTANVGSQLRIGRGDARVALARFDALRAALGDESDKLAVAHLDGEAVPDRPERVVASFFPAKDVPQLVVDAHERAANGSAARDAEDPEASPEKPQAPAKSRAPRIPRHH
jgi:cell division protein FtsQ